MAAFYLVGYLSGFLAEQMKKSRTELKETRLDLDKLEVLHESIINSMTSGLIVVDDKERVILFNPSSGRDPWHQQRSDLRAVSVVCPSRSSGRF